MSKKIERYVIPYSEYTDPMIDSAFSALKLICQEFSAENITLVVPSLSSFPNSMIGKKFAKSNSIELANGKTIIFFENVQMKAFDKRSFNPNLSYEILFEAFLPQKDANVVDSTKNCKAIVYFPPSPADEKKWIDTWDPIIYGIGRIGNRKEFPLDVKNVLIEFRDYINGAADLSNLKMNEEAHSIAKKVITINSGITPKDICRSVLGLDVNLM